MGCGDRYEKCTQMRKDLKEAKTRAAKAWARSVEEILADRHAGVALETAGRVMEFDAARGHELQARAAVSALAFSRRGPLDCGRERQVCAIGREKLALWPISSNPRPRLAATIACYRTESLSSKRTAARPIVSALKITAVPSSVTVTESIATG